jgi:uncharacterized membrane protein YgcG
MRRGTWSIIAIAVLGLVLALALGIFADTIARGTVALPSTNLERTDTPLAPEQAVTRPAPKRTPKRRATTTGTTTQAATTSTEAGDDHGGRRKGRGSDDSSSGSGSSGSGKSDDSSHGDDD